MALQSLWPKALLFILAVALTACGGNSESGQSDNSGTDAAASDSAVKSASTPSDGLDSLDPQARLKAYNRAIGELEKRGGGQVDGMSLAALTRARDTLAQRADCYADPAPDCLLPFASPRYQQRMNPAKLAYERARRVICKSGFAAAEKVVGAYKINRPNHARELVQLAFAAEECGRPEDVQAAIRSYVATETREGQQRIDALMSVLNTEELQAGWPLILTELDRALDDGELEPNLAARVAFGVVMAHASLGDAAAAQARLDYVTDTLGFRVDMLDLRELAIAHLAAGSLDAALATTSPAQDARFENPVYRGMRVTVSQGAAAELARRLGLVTQESSASAAGGAPIDLTGGKRVQDLLAPVSGSDAADVRALAEGIQAHLVKALEALQPADVPLGHAGADTTYGLLALAWWKLGEEDRAMALLDKGEQVRTAAGPGGGTPNYLAEHQMLIALAQDRIDDAIKYTGEVATSQTRSTHRSYHIELVLAAIARTGDVEKALSAFGGAAARTERYATIVDALVEVGDYAKAENVIEVNPSGAKYHEELRWHMIESAIGHGDLERARALAGKFNLLTYPQARLRLTGLVVAAHIEAGNRAAAESALREYMAIGEELDGASTSSAASQNAATLAFEAGYTDLGIELYRQATRKTIEPLLVALQSEATQTAHVTKILMLPHGVVSTTQMYDVIDAAIEYLALRGVGGSAV